MLTILKTCGLSAMLVCGTCLCVSDAQACGSRSRCCCNTQPSCCAPSCAAPTAAPATDAPPPPVEKAAAGQQRYQSAYQPAPAYMSPSRSASPMRGSTDQFRVDRKFMGQFGR